MTKTAAARNKGTGQFTYTNKWDRPCARCGGTLGGHEAEAPHANNDASMGPECAGFKPARVAR